MERLYVIVDVSIPTIALKAAQAGHAVASWLLQNPDQTWNNSYLILLESDLSVLLNKFDNSNVDYSVFKEPDLNDVITAVATTDKRFLKKIKLLGSD